MEQKYKKFHFPHYTYNSIQSAYIPSTAFIALSQDTKTSCTPCVSIGDIVTEGQIIARNEKDNVNIHASIPGLIKGFQDCTMPDGSNSQCIVISLKGSLSTTGKERSIHKWKYDSTNTILSNIQEKGVINTLDSHFGCLANQISNLESDHCSLNVLLFDFDTSSTLSRNSLKFYTDEIFEGAIITATAMNAKTIVFFYDKNDTELLENENVKSIIEDIETHFVPVDCTHYPSASPFKIKTLIKKEKDTLGITVSKRSQLTIDTVTALSTYKAIVHNLASTETMVEINGSALHKPCLFSAKIGTPISKLIAECGGTEKPPAKIVVNGLIKGTAISDIHTPVTKYLKTISLLASKDVPDEHISICIHCGLCRSTCPIRLSPDLLYAHKVDNLPIEDEILQSSILCDECALCNIRCPARLPLYQTISQIKEDIDETKI